MHRPPREPTRWEWAGRWGMLCIANVLLPWVAASALGPTSRRGQVLGIVAWAVFGGWACGGRPRLGRRACLGAGFLAAAQVLMLPHALAGFLAAYLLGRVGVTMVEPTVDLGNFLMTITTGGILVAMGLAFGTGFLWAVGPPIPPAAEDGPVARAAAIAREQGRWTGEALFD